MNTITPPLIVLSLCLSLSFTTHAQNSFGVRVGLSPGNKLHTEHVLVNTGTSVFEFNTDRVKRSLCTGVYYRKALKNGFFLQGEALYAYHAIDYRINYLDNDGPDLMAHEATHQIALPAAIGIELNGFEVLSGMTANVLINCTSDLSEFTTFSEDLSAVRFAWQSGIGLALHAFRFEMRYEMDFSNFGADMYLYDQHLRLTNANNKLVFGISYAL